MDKDTKLGIALVVTTALIAVAVFIGFWQLREVKRDVAHIKIEQEADRLCDRIRACPWIEILQRDIAK